MNVVFAHCTSGHGADPFDPARVRKRERLLSFDFAARTSGVMSHADAVRQIRTRVLEGKTSYADVVRTIRPAALRVKTEQFFDAVQSLLVEATDAAVLLVPSDPHVSEEPETAIEILAAKAGRWNPQAILKRKNGAGCSPRSLPM
jgi:hypothetical protein